MRQGRGAGRAGAWQFRVAAYAVALVAGSVLLSCAREEPAAAAKVLQVELRSEPVKGGSGAPSGGPGWRLQIPEAYVSSSSGARRLRVLALYPTMEHFTPAARDRWFRKTPAGSYGAYAEDVIKIDLSLAEDGQVESGRRSWDVLIVQLAEGMVARAPAGLPDTAVTVYRAPRFRDDRLDLGVPPTDAVFVLDEALPTRSIARCAIVCVVWTSWGDRLGVEYAFPRNRLADFRAYDSAVRRLIGSFQPVPFGQ